MNSDTPLTDAAAEAEIGKSSIGKGWYVHADFARDLERELSDMKAQKDALRKAFDDLHEAYASALEKNNSLSFALSDIRSDHFKATQRLAEIENPQQ